MKCTELKWKETIISLNYLKFFSIIVSFAMTLVRSKHCLQSKHDFLKNGRKDSNKNA